MGKKISFYLTSSSFVFNIDHYVLNTSMKSWHLQERFIENAIYVLTMQSVILMIREVVYDMLKHDGAIRHPVDKYYC